MIIEAQETCSNKNRRTRNYEKNVATTGMEEETCTEHQSNTKPIPEESKTTLNYLLTIYLISSYLKSYPIKLKMCHIMSCLILSPKFIRYSSILLMGICSSPFHMLEPSQFHFAHLVPFHLDPNLFIPNLISPNTLTRPHQHPRSCKFHF